MQRVVGKHMHGLYCTTHVHILAEVHFLCARNVQHEIEPGFETHAWVGGGGGYMPNFVFVKNMYIRYKLYSVCIISL